MPDASQAYEEKIAHQLIRTIGFPAAPNLLWCRMRRFWFLIFLCCGIPCTRAAASPGHGLSASNGVLLLEGQPYRGVGANYFSLLSRTLTDPKDTSSLTNLAALARRGIPFVRFMCGGFWPSEQQLYLTNASLFFSRLDVLVRCAESNRIGLIPSLFWHTPTACDLVGEPMQSLGDTNSRSLAYVRQSTRDVVSRYRHSPAIWAWEFGNELNLGVDLPNAAEHRPPTPPRLGTPAQRTARDELRSSDMVTAYGVFAAAVRELDTHRLMITGNSVPRPQAWHNSQEKNWQRDTVAQFKEILLRDNPNPIDSISIHVYAADAYGGQARTPAELIHLVSAFARAQHKPLFVGEFGIGREAGTLVEQRSAYAELLKAIDQAQVPLAAFWVFDLPMQEKDWNCAFENDRRFMIDMAAALNPVRRK